MKHIHLFQHINGGCKLSKDSNGNQAQCDDSYECECGAKFKTRSNINTHYTMPNYIAGKDEPE